MPTQAERRSATRGALLSAARSLFGSNGFAQVTIDSVAALAGVTKGGVYHHFGSKDALFEQVLVAEQQRLAEAARPSGAGGPIDLVASAFRNYLVAAAAEPTRQIVLIDGPAVLGWARWREIDERMFGQTVRQATAAIRGRDEGAREIRALATLIMGAVTEAALVCATAPDPDETARELADALRSLIAGIHE